MENNKLENFDDPAKSLQPQNQEEQEFLHYGVAQHLRTIWERTLQTFVICRSILRFGASPRATASGLHFGQVRIKRSSNEWR